MLVALGVAVVAFGFQQTAVIPAIPTIEHALHASRTWTAWVLSGYLVASSVFTPLVGKLGDRIGKRRMLVTSLVVFLVGSVGAGLAPGLAVLVVFRAVQGVGGAVFPLTLAMARDLLPDDRVGAGIGLLTGGFGLGTALGFGLSGFLITTAGWRWIFGAGAIVVVAAVAVTATVLPASRRGHGAGLDLPGAALLGAGLALILVALTEGALRGWSSPFVLGAFVLGFGLLAAWVQRERHTAQPLLDVRLFVRRPVLMANLATLALGYVLFSVYFLLPYLLHSGPHGGPVATGLLLFPAALGELAAGPLAGLLQRRIGVRATFALGLAVLAAAALGFTVAHHGVAPLAAWSLLLGIGAGLGIATGSTVIAERAGDAEVGIATAMNSVLRRVGGGVGGQVSAVLLAGATADSTFGTAFLVCAVVAGAGTVVAVGIGSPRSCAPGSSGRQA